MITFLYGKQNGIKILDKNSTEDGKATQSRWYSIKKGMFLSFLFTFFLVYGHTQDTLNTLRSLDREFYVSGEERAEWSQDVMLDGIVQT